MAEAFPSTFELGMAREALEKLHEQACAGSRRFEFTRNGCDDVCVMMSKHDLIALEKALDVLAETDNYKSLCEALTRLLYRADEVFPAPADPNTPQS